MRCSGLVCAWLVACGTAVEAPAPTPTPARAPSIAAPSGDLLLARARLSIEGGVLAPELEQRIVDSTAPEHAHAQRLLAAMREGVPAVAGDDGDPLAVPAAPAVAPVAEPPAPVPVSAPPPTVDPAAAKLPAKTPAPPGSPAPAPVPAVPGAATLESLSMRASDRGATLTIQASSGVLVGVANQPGAGIVRLVLDDVRAAPKVLSSRPGVTGARVRDVAKSGSGVRITLALEPGWRFGGVQRTGKGAKISLLAP